MEKLEGQGCARLQQARLCGRGLGFDDAIARNGYRWWYLDGFSDDGQAAITVILFVGSVFSPYYARARRLGRGDPENFCGANIILYGPKRHLWSLTERGSPAVSRSASSLRLGPSQCRWHDDRLEIEVDEVAVPWPRRLRGKISVALPSLSSQCYALDEAGQHRWWPLAPSAQISVDFERPHLQWRGHAYVDSNAGVVPLEQSFEGWHWSRTECRAGQGLIQYNTRPLTGKACSLQLAFDPHGGVRPARSGSLPTPVSKTGIWRVAREIALPSEARIEALETLEDTPFYARSRLSYSVAGDRQVAMHESLDLRRFKRRWVQALLPFRMPRRAGRG